MTMDEFVEGILRCKGPARAMDQAIVPRVLVLCTGAYSVMMSGTQATTAKFTKIKQCFGLNTWIWNRQRWVKAFPVKWPQCFFVKGSASRAKSVL